MARADSESTKKPTRKQPRKARSEPAQFNEAATLASLAHRQRRFLTVLQWTQAHTWPPEGGLRHLIFHAKRFGFDKVIRRVGRRVLIDEAAFFEWMAERNMVGDE